ncbi:MAG: TolC family protein [Odoribacter sp.]|nr:TolC family protein [Odoribacter sp.]
MFYTASAQLTLEECQVRAYQNYPLIGQYELIEKTREYNLENAAKGYLPQFSLSAKATYQSDVTKMPIDISGLDIKSLSKDQYQTTLDMSQFIWDGGVIKARKESYNAEADISQRQLSVDMYAIRNRVNNLFFSVLLMDAQLDQNSLYQAELQRNYNTVKSYMDNGIANQIDVDAVKVEQIKAMQDSIQLKSNRKAYLEMLGIMIGEKLNENTELVKPDFPVFYQDYPIMRPELALLDARVNALEVQRQMIKANNMPHIGLFVTGGYGRPGLNMLEGDFKGYYIGGINLSWNFGGLYTKKNDNRLIDVNIGNLDVQRETFLFNTSIDQTQYVNEINKNRDILDYDNQVIELRENVKNAAEVKVANGTMTVIDFMREVTSENMARQDKIQHEIEMLLSAYNLKYVTNN